MNKVWITLGTLLAASSALIFLAGRDANRRQAKIPAARAAALLSDAWSDNRTRA